MLWHGVADSTTASLKKKLLNCYTRYQTERPVFLGGLNRVVEIDESVLSRRGVISNPTSTSDTTPDTVWILGGIDCDGNFFLKRVANRTVTELTNAMYDVVLVGSKLHTDGFASYPRVAANIGVKHRTVNHSIGFVGEDGIHTNNIEGFWSHLKGSMRRENGVKRENIDNWLLEYSFKRRYLMHASREDFMSIYCVILKYLFE